jgi:hypothetical protein
MSLNSYRAMTVKPAAFCARSLDVWPRRAADVLTPPSIAPFTGANAKCCPNPYHAVRRDVAGRHCLTLYEGSIPYEHCDRLHYASAHPKPDVLVLDPQIDYLPPSMREAYRETEVPRPGDGWHRRLQHAHDRRAFRPDPASSCNRASTSKSASPGLVASAIPSPTPPEGHARDRRCQRNDIGSTAAAYARTFLAEAT